MAATTPVLWFKTGVTGVRLDEVLRVNRSVYAGAGAHRETRWQLSLTNAFPAAAPNLVWDSLLREDNDHDLGSDWLELPLAIIPLAISTAHYLSCLDRNTLDESSAWATAVTFATAAALTAAVWRVAAS